MSKLIDPRGVRKIKLPSFSEDEVELYEGFLTYQLNEFTKVKEDFDRGVLTLEFLIKSWTFVDEDDKTLKVTKENIGLLPSADFEVLMSAVGDIMDTVNGKKQKS
jgi:hypothetical protein